MGSWRAAGVSQSGPPIDLSPDAEGKSVSLPEGEFRFPLSDWLLGPFCSSPQGSLPGNHKCETEVQLAI